MFFSDFPQEIKERIAKKLPPREALRSRTICKDWDLAVKKTVGSGTKYELFLKRVEELSSVFKYLILSGKYTLGKAENIILLSKLSLVQLGKMETLTQTQREKLNLLLSDNGLIAFEQHLLTLEQANSLEPFILKLLLSTNGMLALLKGLISIDQAKEIQHYLRFLFTDNGIIALEEGLITPAQIFRLGYTSTLESLLSDNGIIALRKKLINPDNIGAVAPDLYYLNDVIENLVVEKSTETSPCSIL